MKLSFLRRRRLVVCFIMVGIAFIAAHEIPREVSRWYVAAAISANRDGDLVRAIRRTEQALAWDPSNTDLYWLRVRVNQRLRRHRQAIKDWDVLVQMARAGFEIEEIPTQKNRDGYAHCLNGRAYERALGQIEIDQGIADIELAFDILGREDDYAMLDTRGYLRFLANDLVAARADLELAVELAEMDFERLSVLRQSETARAAQHNSIARLMLVRETFPVLYHHRGHLYEKLGRSREAKADLDHAKELGYNPDKGVW